MSNKRDQFRHSSRIRKSNGLFGKVAPFFVPFLRALSLDDPIPQSQLLLIEASNDLPTIDEYHRLDQSYQSIFYQQEKNKA